MRTFHNGHQHIRRDTAYKYNPNFEMESDYNHWSPHFVGLSLNQLVCTLARNY